MKVLIFGPSGAGKTYVTTALSQQGINAFDADDLPGLSNWYNREGKKVAPPKTADEALSKGYAFLWSIKFLRTFLDRTDDVYLFGGSGNITSAFPLFDKIYFLQIDPKVQRERLRSPDRPTPLMDQNDNGPIVWGEWLEQMAKDKGVPFVDATLTPDDIFNIISRK